MRLPRTQNAVALSMTWKVYGILIQLVKALCALAMTWNDYGISPKIAEALCALAMTQEEQLRAFLTMPI